MEMICKCFSCHYLLRRFIFSLSSRNSFGTFTFSRLHKSQPLLNLGFAIVDSKREHRKSIENMIKNMGGTVTTKIHYNLAAVISNPTDIRKDSILLKYAKKCNVHVISEEFLLDVVHGNDPIQSIRKRSLCKWGGDVSGLNAGAR